MNKTLKRTLAGLFLIFALSASLTAKEKSKSEEPVEDSEKKNYMGWIDTSDKDVSVRIGNIRMNAKTKLGTFNISVINENGKKVPVLYSGNEYSSTGFYLKVNNKIYRLIAESNIKTAARKTSTGMQINYSIKNVAEVFVDFRCLKSSADSGYDMVKITSTVTNTGNKRADYALKLILDTVLGESDNTHFYTSTDVPVKAEVLYRTMQNEKWFSSKNKNTEMQILLDGADITAPELVALANYSTLEKTTWEPEMLSYRTFDTVLSYNNSAVGIIWPGKKLGVDSRLTDCFYLAFGVDGQKAQGNEYVEGKKHSDIDVAQTVENMTKPKKETPKEYSLEDAIKNEPVTTIELEEPAIKPVEPPVPAVKETYTPPVYEKPVVTTVVEPKKPVRTNKLSSEQLTPEYIQNLIDRITAMENDPDMASDEEIKLLNAELDAILQALM